MGAISHALTTGIVILGLLLGACSSRPTSEVLRPYAPEPRYTSKVELLVATTRERGDGDDPDAFTAARATHVNYAALTVSIPKHHAPGQIEWPDQVPADPLYHFVTTQRVSLVGPEFLDRLRNRARAGGPEAGSVMVFVHGYNTLYEESVYRFAQIVHDSGYEGTAVLFAWPSRGKAPLYLADRDSSTFSRDYLEETLRRIAAVKEVREVNVLAHSMGSWLAVETLRQAKLKGDRDFNGKLGDVILASPDLDVGVFLTQMQVIGPLKRPLTIFASSDDKALALSAVLAGGAKRVGLVTANDARVIERAEQFNLRVIDLTMIQDRGGTNHTKFAESGAILRAIGHSLAAEDRIQREHHGGLVTAVTEVGKSLVKVPAAVIGMKSPAE